MAETSYPFDAGAGATVNEAQWQAMARRFRQTGVIDGSLNKLLVSADGSALSVSVATGDAFVEGFFYRNDAALALTIATANATNPRIDTVVVRLDRVANSAVLAVVTGTAAASPVAPTLSATDSLYELPLANVLVPAAAGVIVSGNVTDRRTLTQTFDSAAYVAKALADAKGDIFAASAADTVARVGVGADGTVLMADSAAATGVAWGAAPASALVGAMAKSTAALTVGSGTITGVPLEAEAWDTHGFHDNATNNSRLTVPAGQAGKYQAEGWAQFAAHGTGARVAYLFLNGVQAARLVYPANAADPHGVSASKPMQLAVGDYVEFAVYQLSGGALALSAIGTGETAWLALTKIGA